MKVITQLYKSEFIRIKSGTHSYLFVIYAGFPNVLGCIDCTHIRLKKPNNNVADFVNRKGYHSLNVQVQISYILHHPFLCTYSCILVQTQLFIHDLSM